ncbi:MAG: phage holin family protein [Sphingomonas sp.]|nr:phage holin family protein [Sphingomonas sp.]
MLKPPNEPKSAPVDNDRPVGELVHQLIEDGKAYAKAELDVLKAIATAKANAFRVPAILFGAAFLLALAAIVALAVGVAMGLATLIGPLAGGLVAFLLFAGIAGGLGWYGVKRLREDL